MTIIVKSVTMTIDTDKDLTIIKLTGKLAFQEMLAIHKSFYETSETTKHLLVDVTQGSWENISSQEMENLVNYLKRNRDKRPKDARTALVVSRTLEFGMGRMHQILSEIKEVEIVTEIFDSVDEALNWLKE